MISAVLFDLDGTLLDIDLDVFLGRYFGALGPVLADLTGLPDQAALRALHRATEAMFGDHPGLTNRAVFDEAFEAATGVHLASDMATEAIDRFYATEFPKLRDTHGPRQGAKAAVATATGLGLPLALATNPIFPRAAIVERLAWAELSTETFSLITTYETSRACKPRPEYFNDIALALGVPAEECLMVGDDPALDLGAARAGMKTFFVGDGVPPLADECGSLEDLARRLGEMLG